MVNAKLGVNACVAHRLEEGLVAPWTFLSSPVMSFGILKW